MDRSSVAIRKWLPLSLAGAAISLITALLFRVPIGRASALIRISHSHGLSQVGNKSTKVNHFLYC
ncbi:MAG: hypothetical protein WAZ77_21355 [Candidatus Nitrosopolaris sp.]